MSATKKVVFFVINQLQDVNIVRGLVYLTARETDAAIAFLVSPSFVKRDGGRIWQGELAALAADTRARMYLFGDAADAKAALDRYAGGLVFAASEPSLAAHAEAAEVFRVAPASYLRVALQHGFECVGLQRRREHITSHGENVTFGADVICSWFDVGSLSALPASQRAKLYVTGPPTLIQRPREHPDHPPEDGGLVCENLHSDGLPASGDHRTCFMEVFLAFCAKLSERGERVTLRPDPEGQFTLKNKVELPENVTINNVPIFDVNPKRYGFGISAPSTILFDMIVAGIPVAVWRDPDGIMDFSNYDGLRQVSTLDDWLEFARDVRTAPEEILECQTAFLRSLAMPTDPAQIYVRFARLIVAALEGLSGNPQPRGPLEVGVSAEPQPREPRSLTLAGNLLVQVNR